MDSKIKVLVADCDSDFRETLIEVLGDCKPIEIVGYALERDELLSSLRKNSRILSSLI